MGSDAQVSLSRIWSGCSTQSPGWDSRTCRVLGVAAVPLPTLECFVSLWTLAWGMRSCGHPELCTL